jgi:hypothetical protein
MTLDLVKKHIPIIFTFQQKNILIHASKHNNIFYINTNNLCNNNTTFTTSRWKRTKDATNLINLINNKIKPFKPYISDKTYGTWINTDLFESFGNWLHSKSLQPKNFGTYIKNNIKSLYNNHKNNPFFTTLTNTSHIRANKNNNFINITDLTRLYQTDIRTWKKNKDIKQYLTDKPSHYISGNNITDNIGLKVTYCHPTLAILIVKKINKIHPSKHFDSIIKFITVHVNKLNHTQPIEKKKIHTILEDDSSNYKNDVMNKPIERKEPPTQKLNLTNLTQDDFKNYRTTPDAIPIAIEGQRDDVNAIMDVRHPIDIKESSNPVQKLNIMNLTQDDFKGVRMTQDGLFSVYDAIAKFKECSTKRAQESFSNIEVSEKLRNVSLHKFQGRGQKPTPVCTFTELLQIFSQLPGKQSIVLRKEQAGISSRAIAGDEDLEEAVREQRVRVSEPLVIKNNKELVLNNYTLSARKEDGYIDITNLCKAGGKEYSGWYRSQKTKAFLQVLSMTMQHCMVDLIKSQSGANGDRHTWCHPQVAINIAQWCSPEFDVQVSK